MNRDRGDGQALKWRCFQELHDFSGGGSSHEIPRHMLPLITSPKRKESNYTSSFSSSAIMTTTNDNTTTLPFSSVKSPSPFLAAFTLMVLVREMQMSSGQRGIHVETTL